MALSKQEQQYQDTEVIHNHHLRTVSRETTEGLNIFTLLNLQNDRRFQKKNQNQTQVSISVNKMFSYEKVPAFHSTILHVIKAPASGVVLTVAVIVKRQTSARVITLLSYLK